MAQGIKTGGRRKGTQNKLTRDVQAFVDKVFRHIDPVEKLTELLSSESEKVQAGVMLRLLEYRYGKPKESIELTGTLTYTEALTKAKERLRAHLDRPS